MTTPLLDTPEQEEEKDAPGDELFSAVFDDELFVGGGKSHLSRCQNRAIWQKCVKQKLKHLLEISAEELQKLQEEDPTLSVIRKATSGDISAAGVGFYKKEGLLYRHWTPPGRVEDDMSIEQLVLPQQCREMVLQLAQMCHLLGIWARRRLLEEFCSGFVGLASLKMLQNIANVAQNARSVLQGRRAEHPHPITTYG